MFVVMNSESSIILLSVFHKSNLTNDNIEID
jgi:hypothetical protein